ncbi:hypothetical protein HNR21_000543 [Actinomadura cellulosilytica]|uniref:Uncharacterized protein n=1 Tax=Thermomonospora cellulosilytica TaxID=1411118 RepID=A0A7W3MTM2_9ACTN|nr:hypothetical protein [Thermomonospora cellulosilytica]
MTKTPRKHVRLGGTGDVVEHARKIGVPVDVVWPDGAERE